MAPSCCRHKRKLSDLRSDADHPDISDPVGQTHFYGNGYRIWGISVFSPLLVMPARARHSSDVPDGWEFRAHPGVVCDLVQLALAPLLQVRPQCAAASSGEFSRSCAVDAEMMVDMSPAVENSHSVPDDIVFGSERAWISTSWLTSGIR